MLTRGKQNKARVWYYKNMYEQPRFVEHWCNKSTIFFIIIIQDMHQNSAVSPYPRTTISFVSGSSGIPLTTKCCTL